MKLLLSIIVLLSLACMAQIPAGLVGGQIPDTGITFTPSAGAVSNPTTVTFSGARAGSIYCSTQDGSTPFTNGIGTACGHGSLGSTTSITSAVTVKVVSGLLGELDSAVSSAAYTISGGYAAPVFSAVADATACTASGSTGTCTISVASNHLVIAPVSSGNGNFTSMSITDSN